MYHSFNRRPGTDRCFDCGETCFGGFHFSPSAVKAHAYEPKDPEKPWYRTSCRYCKNGPGASVHLYVLPGMEKAITHYEPEPEVEEPEPVRVEVTRPQMALFGPGGL